MFALLLLVALSSCSNKPDATSVILGKWKSSENTNGIIRFLKDGTLVAEEGGNVQAGSYKIIGENIIEMQVGDHVQSGKFSILSNDEVLLTITNLGTSDLLKRIPD